MLSVFKNYQGIRMKVLVSLVLLMAGSLSYAGGSITSSQINKLVATNSILQSFVNNGMVIESCSGSRFGSHWDNLSGGRIGPYGCVAKMFSKEIFITLNTESLFLDVDGNVLDENSDDIFSHAYDLTEKVKSFTISK